MFMFLANYIFQHIFTVYITDSVSLENLQSVNLSIDVQTYYK